MANGCRIFESELSVIAYEANQYSNCETGGDLYGLWTASGEPVIYLAVGPGPMAIVQNYDYEMDIEYMKKCEAVLQANFGIHYLGDWHSHHNLSLYQPSPGDQNRIQRLMRINDVYNMAEIIVTHQQEKGSGQKERIDAYSYNGVYLLQNEVLVLDDLTSPIRSALQSPSAAKVFNLGGGEFPMDRILINTGIIDLDETPSYGFPSGNNIGDALPGS
ncbi:MAG: hypothetical protein FWG03_02115 [Clostridiales bacterium]|nr:hypothetical protein [Clostridiales bacterium]